MSDALSTEGCGATGVGIFDVMIETDIRSFDVALRCVACDHRWHSVLELRILMVDGLGCAAMDEPVECPACGAMCGAIDG